jgi:hypothetical protein
MVVVLETKYSELLLNFAFYFDSQPYFMAAFSFMSIAITSCSVVIFGVGISDPIALLVGPGRSCSPRLGLISILFYQRASLHKALT